MEFKDNTKGSTPNPFPECVFLFCSAWPYHCFIIRERSATPRAPCCYKPPVSNCNCTCNANQDLPVILKTLETKLDRVKSLIGLNNNNNSDLGDALKSLEAKMEGLIALINNTSSFFPPRTPKPTGQQKYELMLNS